MDPDECALYGPEQNVIFLKKEFRLFNKYYEADLRK
jgi:hypothetical protein